MIPNEKLRLASVYISASQQVQLSLASNATIGALTASMTALDNTLNASTLELALPLARRQRLGNLALATGDRLLLMANTPKQVPLPARVNTYETQLRFTIDGQEVAVASKSGYLIGASQHGSDVLPDVDLRPFIPPTLADLIAEGCVWLQYDPYQRQWFASRIGNTRVLLDEYELQGDKFPLVRTTKLRLYPQGVTFMGANRLLAEVAIRVEDNTGQGNRVNLPHGDLRTRLVLGVEQALGVFDASPDIELQTVADKLLAHAKIPQTSQIQVYALRLLSPQDTISTSDGERDSFFYLARSTAYVRSALRLRGMGQTKAQFELFGASISERRTMGCRTYPNLPEVALDIDLYDWMMPKEDALLPHTGRIWASLEYVAEGAEWWLRPADVPMPLFVNERHVGVSPVRLLDDSLISIGFEGSQLVLRFAVEITVPR